MNASRVGLLVGAMLAAALARPAAGDGCRPEEIDAQGKCPKKPPPAPPPSVTPPSPPPVKPPPPPPVRRAQPAAKPTQLDVRGPDATGAQVLIDGKPAGRAPLLLPAAPGRHLVEVRRDGHVPYAEWIEVKRGERRLVQVKLMPAAAAVPPGTPPPPAPAPGAARCPAGMVRVPAGTFQMGNSEGDPIEYPPHAVTLSAYCIDQTEVTVKAYGACVAAGKCSAADLEVSRYCNRGDRPAHPVNCVDWNQAAAYCKWVDKRLPTEAEWEYAARGTDGRTYPWGNEAPSAKRLNACGSECVARVKRDEKQQWPAMYTADDGWETTAPVGSFLASASPFGVLDMAGNVWEWTADRHGRYSEEAATNPRGGASGMTRMFRGGGWGSFWAGDVSTSHRAWEMPTHSAEVVGFRCARGE